MQTRVVALTATVHQLRITSMLAPKTFRRTFQALAENSLRDAKVLFRARRYRGSYFASGFAIECALKACLAKQTQRFEFPDKKRAQECHDHRLDVLRKLAGLDIHATTNLSLQKNWCFVQDWESEGRYRLIDRSTAEKLYNAVGDPSSGVFRWIRAHW